MKTKILGFFLLLISVSLILFVLYKNSKKRQTPLVYTPQLMANALWNVYKGEYWENDTGRTVDKQRESITTSEGQSYTMLRAVWLDDKPTFDKTWQWTKNNLQRSDSLFSWLYGKRTDNSWGILEDRGGQNAATDADTDIALALLMASRRWNDPAYLEESKKIVSSVWNLEVVVMAGKPYVVSNNVERESPHSALINPSYLSPHAYREFATIDPEHDWQAVVDSSYELISASITAPLDKQRSAGLPPDWIRMEKTSGKLLPPSAQDLTTNFSYDALRLPWRMALDWKWNQEPRAKAVLSQISFLGRHWQEQHALYASFSHDGTAIERQETPAMYGGTIGYFMAVDPETAKTVYEEKLVRLYNPDIQAWRQPMSYYDDNWAWFGLGLYNNLLLPLRPLPSQ